MATLGGNAAYLVERLSKVEGLRVIVPQACMYIMVRTLPSLVCLSIIPYPSIDIHIHVHAYYE
jgi:hypothetical protein